MFVSMIVFLSELEFLLVVNDIRPFTVSTLSTKLTGGRPNAVLLLAIGQFDIFSSIDSRGDLSRWRSTAEVQRCFGCRCGRVLTGSAGRRGCWKRLFGGIGHQR